MDDDLDDYKLDTTWHRDTSHVVHTSFERDHRHRGRKVKIETKWHRKGELGVGSCGVVHLETTEDGGERAVKCIKKSMAARLKIDYRRELAAISTFSRAKYQQHQIFVEFLGWFEDPEFIFVAMEYLPLGDLNKHVSEDIQEHDLKDISSQLLEGLRLMHSKGFTHRDLKPQNIFVVQTTPSWWVKIGDFGIAKRVRDGDATELRTATGTQGYEAPEIRGYVEVDEQNPSSVYTNVVDMWSFGCVIYKIAAKQVPFQTGRDIKWFCDKRKSFPVDPLHGKLTTNGIDFLRSILVANPLARPTADVALEHSWLIADEKDIEYHQGSNTELADREELSSPPESNVVRPMDRLYRSESRENLGSRIIEIQNDFQAGAKDAVVVEDRRSRPLSPGRNPEDLALNIGLLPISNVLPLGPKRDSRLKEETSDAPPECERVQESVRNGHTDTEAKSGKYFNSQGILAFDDKNWDLAISHFTRALQFRPGSTAYLCNRAVAHIHAGSYDKAQYDAEDAIKGDRNRTVAWYRLGSARYMQYRLEESMAALHECIARKPHDTGMNAEEWCTLAGELLVKIQSILEDKPVKFTDQKPQPHVPRSSTHQRALVPAVNRERSSLPASSSVAAVAKEPKQKTFLGFIKGKLEERRQTEEDQRRYSNKRNRGG